MTGSVHGMAKTMPQRFSAASRLFLCILLTTAGKCDGVTDPNPRLRGEWQEGMPGAGRFVTPPPPIVVGERVIFGTGDGRLQARDTATGALRWESAGFGAPMDGVLMLARDGVIVATTPYETVVVDDATGAHRWRYAAPPDLQAPEGSGGGYVGRSYLAADADNVYIPAWGGSVSAVDLRSGARRWVWKVDPARPNRSGVAGVAVSGDTVFATVWHWLVPNGARSEVSLLALDRRTGAELWRIILPGEGSGSLPWTRPLIAGNRIVTTAGGNLVVAVDRASREIAWRAQHVFSVRPPVLRDGVVYICSAASLETGAVQYRGLDAADGSVRWTADLTGSAQSSFDLVVTDRRVLVSTGGRIVVLDRQSGRRITEVFHPKGHATGGFATGPVFAGGRVFVGLIRFITDGTPNVRYEASAFSFREP